MKQHREVHGDARRLLVEKWRKDVNNLPDCEAGSARAYFEGCISRLLLCANELEAALSPEAVPSCDCDLKGEQMTFQQELERLINKHSQENSSGTPDFILAEYLMACLIAYNGALAKREAWYGRPVSTLQGASSPEDTP